MCGIFGFIGNNNAGKIVLEGLKRLEYRGYDSWGIAVAENGKIFVQKNTGKIGQITQTDFSYSHAGIGHTRWATTGAVTKINAHPHYSSDKSFALAQNGIVENYEELKEKLIKKGYKFLSETDTEVIVRLIEKELVKTKNIRLAVSRAFKQLKGRNTIILITKDQEILAVRNGSPLVVGFGKDQIYLSSDTLSFAPYTKKVLVVDNGQMVIAGKSVSLIDNKTDRKIEVNIENIEIKAEEASKEKYPHYMLKEIHEAPFVLGQLIKQSKKTYEDIARAIKHAKNVYTIGSGGAGVAAAQIGYYLRSIGKIKAVSLIGADAEEYEDLFTSSDLIIVISQSGETADVLEVIERAKKKGVKTTQLKGDVGHKKAISRGGKSVLANLFVQDPGENRSFSRNKDGSMLSERSKREKKRKA